MPVVKLQLSSTTKVRLHSLWRSLLSRRNILLFILYELAASFASSLVIPYSPLVLEGHVHSPSSAHRWSHLLDRIYLNRFPQCACCTCNVLQRHLLWYSWYTIKTEFTPVCHFLQLFHPTSFKCWAEEFSSNSVTRFMGLLPSMMSYTLCFRYRRCCCKQVLLVLYSATTPHITLSMFTTMTSQGTNSKTFLVLTIKCRCGKDAFGKLTTKKLSPWIYLRWMEHVQKIQSLKYWSLDNFSFDIFDFSEVQRSPVSFSKEISVFLLDQALGVIP